MKNQEKNIKVEALLTKIADAGIDVDLPLGEDSVKTQQRTKFFKDLVAKGLLSEEDCNKFTEELKNRTLRDELYDLYSK